MTDRKNRFPQILVTAFCALAFFIAIAVQIVAEESTAPGDAELFERLQLLSHEERIDAPDFTLPDMHGNTLTLSDLQGQVVFLNFWTTW